MRTEESGDYKDKREKEICDVIMISDMFNEGNVEDLLWDIISNIEYHLHEKPRCTSFSEYKNWFYIGLRDAEVKIVFHKMERNKYFSLFIIWQIELYYPTGDYSVVYRN